MKQLILLIITLMPIYFVSCVNNGCDGITVCWAEYDISLSYESDPPIREISVGDTFQISMKIPHIVEDTETGEMYDIENLDYSKIFSMSLMDTSNNTYISAPVNSFEYIKLNDNVGDISISNIGGFTQNVNLKLAFFEEYKSISFYVIAKEVGLYWADLFYDWNQLVETESRHSINLTDTCCLEKINLKHEYLSVENKNKDLIPDLKQWGDVTAGGTTPAKRVDLDDPEVEKIGIFFFRVVE